MFLSGSLLLVCVMPPVGLVLVLIACYGRIKYATVYKESTGKRMEGFVSAWIAEQLVGGFMLFIAVKTVF